MLPPRPSTEGSAFAPIHEDDHAGYIWIVTILSLIYSTSIGAVRAYIKWRLLGIDDYLMGLASVLHIAQCIVVFSALSNGLAKWNSITTEAQWSANGTLFGTTETLAVLTLCVTKCCVAAILIRVFTLDRLKGWVLCMGAAVLCGIWGVGSAAALGANCEHDTLFTDQRFAGCPNQSYRWLVITATDIATEVMLFLLPITMTWSLNMSVKLKVEVILAFGLRLPLIAASWLHLRYFKRYSHSSQPQFAVTDALILQQVMVTWSLISATIPNLTSFLRSFSMSMSFPQGWGASNSNGDTTKNSGSHSYPLQTLKRRKLSENKNTRNTKPPRDVDRDDDSQDNDEVFLRPDFAQNSTTIGHESRSDEAADDTCSIGERNSQEMIITKETRWDVHYEAL
ncbi:hypothetical protein F4780DRAFT_477633 [Xylariomycetidae sp. FL0641]|nr:hypothetical protein F4780DRAFT_477633 [Xylariomycetidae sp. FL0641]